MAKNTGLWVALAGLTFVAVGVGIYFAVSNGDDEDDKPDRAETEPITNPGTDPLNWILTRQSIGFGKGWKLQGVLQKDASAVVIGPRVYATAKALAEDLGPNVRPQDNVRGKGDWECDAQAAMNAALDPIQIFWEKPCLGQKPGKKNLYLEGSIGYGVGNRDDNGLYNLEWTLGTGFVSGQPNRDIQYIKYGNSQTFMVDAGPFTQADAEQWLAAMATAPGTGKGVAWRTFPQRAVVRPAPVSSHGIWQCKNAPTGASPSQNLGCGRFKGQRDDLKLTVYELTDPEGWFVARWEYGPVAAGKDREKTMARGLDYVADWNKGL